MAFTHELIVWYRNNKRDLPWRNTVCPYQIWVSEIILQQTRVAQGLPYYNRFMEAFPSVEILAQTDESILLRIWQGLGYYSRARNMHKAAKMVMTKFKGVFPSDYKTLITLPGIGPYTAAAIASFSSGECRAVVDGNVSRVLSRHFGISEPINSAKGQTTLQQLSEKLIPCKAPAEYNQAVMEYGALLCTPKKPLCNACELRNTCHAYKYNLVQTLPVKIKAKQKKNRYFHYFILRDGADSIQVQQRKDSDVWQQLYELPLIEASDFYTLPDLVTTSAFLEQFGENIEVVYESTPKLQILSHQRIHAKFYEIQFTKANTFRNGKADYVFIKDLDKLAKPKLIDSFFKEYFNGLL